MNSFALWTTLVLGQVATSTVYAQGDCDVTWTCLPTTTTPTLDGDLADWNDVPASSNALVMPMTGVEYNQGPGAFRCSFDEEHIYIALEIPGEYRFDTENNKKCAAIGTMMKIGSKATYVGMGGCPDALTSCAENDTIPDSCDDYRVDLGAHWELRTTEQGVAYDINITGGTGNDLVANKDDEFAVSSFCRKDDNDADAGNEWAGAWRHTNPTDGEDGTYIFELSRLLTTQSSISDGQFVPGESYSFGYGFWDPFENPETGWTDAGHYVTGCARNWANLELKNSTDTDAPTQSPTPMSGAPLLLGPGVVAYYLLASIVAAAFVSSTIM